MREYFKKTVPHDTVSAIISRKDNSRTREETAEVTVSWSSKPSCFFPCATDFGPSSFALKNRLITYRRCALRDIYPFHFSFSCQTTDKSLKRNKEKKWENWQEKPTLKIYNKINISLKGRVTRKNYATLVLSLSDDCSVTYQGRLNPVENFLLRYTKIDVSIERLDRE